MHHRFLPLACLAALLVAHVAAAEQLHKCVVADGPPSFQSEPCPADAKTAWVRDYAPDRRPEPPREYAPPPPVADVARVQSRPTPRRIARERCRAAREHEAAMRRDHPTLSYEKLSALSNARTQACSAAR